MPPHKHAKRVSFDTFRVYYLKRKIKLKSVQQSDCRTAQIKIFRLMPDCFNSMACCPLEADCVCREHVLRVTDENTIQTSCRFGPGLSNITTVNDSSHMLRILPFPAPIRVDAPGVGDLSRFSLPAGGQGFHCHPGFTQIHIKGDFLSQRQHVCCWDIFDQGCPL